MILKNVFAAMVCAALLAWSGRSIADEYRPDQFLGLDLSSAVLSPKRLGPPAEFTPIPIEARADRPRERVAGTENARAVAVGKIRVAHRPNAKPPAITQTRVARHHGNPLDAQAQDRRIQAWPCRSGGICGWKR